MEKELRIGIFGDTDNFYSDPYLLERFPFLREEHMPEVDVWIAVNNLTAHGYPFEMERFFKWFSSLKSKYKVAVTGQSDMDIRSDKHLILVSYLKNPNNHFLINNDCVIEGLRIWGSPYTFLHPTVMYSCFSRGCIIDDYDEFRDTWTHIPPDTSIVVTATPPYSIMDTQHDASGQIPKSFGSEDLLYAIKRIKPMMHCFSMKKNHGIQDIDGTKFVNGCIRNEFNHPVSPYEVINIKYNI